MVSRQLREAAALHLVGAARRLHVHAPASISRSLLPSQTRRRRHTWQTGAPGNFPEIVRWEISSCVSSLLMSETRQPTCPRGAFAVDHKKAYVRLRAHSGRYWKNANNV